MTIDWEEQWRFHAPGFKEGFLPLKVGDKTLRLKPGPGFGDFSHPTTRLVLKLMRGNLNEKSVLDIGCGSGILSLAAKASGAKKVFGVDIDPEAIQHAKENALLNNLEISFHLPSDYKAEQIDVVLINMILSEQEVALKALPPLHPLEWIASGLLKTQKKEYERFCALLDLQIIQEAKEGEWIAFRCRKPQ